jgi:hypothetical protein
MNDTGQNLMKLNRLQYAIMQSPAIERDALYEKFYRTYTQFAIGIFTDQKICIVSFHYKNTNPSCPWSDHTERLYDSLTNYFNYNEIVPLKDQYTADNVKGYEEGQKEGHPATLSQKEVVRRVMVLAEERKEVMKKNYQLLFNEKY